MLQAARCFAGTGTPIMGVNLGTVGFLSSVEPENLQFCLDAILHQEYDLEARIMINAAVNRDNQVLYRGTALNDVVLRSRAPHAILVELMIDGKPHTATGGTASSAPLPPAPRLIPSRRGVRSSTPAWKPWRSPNLFSPVSIQTAGSQRFIPVDPGTEF